MKHLDERGEAVSTFAKFDNMRRERCEVDSTLAPRNFPGYQVRRIARDNGGFTLIETTIMLSIMFILAGALSPVVSESITTARAVKAKNDAQLIAAALVNLQKDIGSDAFAYGQGGELSGTKRPERLPDVLMSEGDDPSTDDDAREAAVARASVGNGLLQAPGNTGAPSMRQMRRKWIDLGRDLIDDYMVTNRRGYRLRQPGEYGGWNGPYLSAKLKGDPWGNRYLVNTSWLDGSASAADASGRARRAVFVVSPGANGVIETPFDQPITDAQGYGDDIVVRIQ